MDLMEFQWVGAGATGDATGLASADLPRPGKKCRADAVGVGKGAWRRARNMCGDWIAPCPPLFCAAARVGTVRSERISVLRCLVGRAFAHPTAQVQLPRTLG